MKVDQLDPCPTSKERFHRSHVKFLPQSAGCYVLSSFDSDILYIGLSNNIQRRAIQHLDSIEKISATSHGRAAFVWWKLYAEAQKLERTWQNSHLLTEGGLPVLNKALSPVSC